MARQSQLKMYSRTSLRSWRIRHSLRDSPQTLCALDFAFRLPPWMAGPSLAMTGAIEAPSAPPLILRSPQNAPQPVKLGRTSPSAQQGPLGNKQAQSLFVV
jgi:hypothetical protein